MPLTFFRRNDKMDIDDLIFEYEEYHPSDR